MEPGGGSSSIKSGRWNTDDSPSKKGKKKELNFSEQEDERLQDEEDKNILDTIPDIEDIQEEELTTQISAPPSIAASKITTFKQLDRDLQKHAGLFTSEEGTDLSLLASALSPEAEIQEDNRVWDFDSLFTEMSADIEAIWQGSTQEERINV